MATTATTAYCSFPGLLVAIYCWILECPNVQTLRLPWLSSRCITRVIARYQDFRTYLYHYPWLVTSLWVLEGYTFCIISLCIRSSSPPHKMTSWFWPIEHNNHGRTHGCRTTKFWLRDANIKEECPHLSTSDWITFARAKWWHQQATNWGSIIIGNSAMSGGESNFTVKTA